MHTRFRITIIPRRTRWSLKSTLEPSISCLHLIEDVSAWEGSSYMYLDYFRNRRLALMDIGLHDLLGFQRNSLNVWVIGGNINPQSSTCKYNFPCLNRPNFHLHVPHFSFFSCLFCLFCSPLIVIAEEYICGRLNSSYFTNYHYYQTYIAYCLSNLSKTIMAFCSLTISQGVWRLSTTSGTAWAN